MRLHSTVLEYARSVPLLWLVLAHYSPITICTSNPTFDSHSVFVCFVWISEQTAIISLYNIKLTGFYNRDGVFTARYGLSLYIKFMLILVFKTVLLLRRLVPGFSPRRPRFVPRSVHVKSVVDRVARENFFPPRISGVSCQYHPTNARCCYYKAVFPNLFDVAVPLTSLFISHGTAWGKHLFFKNLFTF
jgi:hypothetical protein